MPARAPRNSDTAAAGPPPSHINRTQRSRQAAPGSSESPYRTQRSRHTAPGSSESPYRTQRSRHTAPGSSESPYPLLWVSEFLDPWVSVPHAARGLKFSAQNSVLFSRTSAPTRAWVNLAGCTEEGCDSYSTQSFCDDDWSYLSHTSGYTPCHQISGCIYYDLIR